jgi:hypothetical protein
VQIDRIVSESRLVVRRLPEAGSPEPPEHPQLLGHVQELLPRDARFMRVRKTFMSLLCALVDQPVPAAVGAMVQGCVASILGSAHRFTHASFRDEWTVGFLHAVLQFVKRCRGWAYGRQRAVLEPALDLLSNLREPFLVLVQACRPIRIFMTGLIFSSESILSVAIS